MQKEFHGWGDLGDLSTSGGVASRTYKVDSLTSGGCCVRYLQDRVWLIPLQVGELRDVHGVLVPLHVGQ